MQAVFDWDLIKREYVQGFVVVDPETGDRRNVYPTYEDLAAKHGCHVGTIAAKASAEKPTWRDQRSHLKAKLAEREDDRRVSYYLSESATLDAEVLTLVRDHLRLVRHYVDQFQPVFREEETIIGEDGEIIPGRKYPEAKLKIQDLEVSSRTLKNLQEVGRRAVSEPVSGVREFLTELKDETSKDAGALRSQIDRLQKRMKNRAKQKQELSKDN